MLDFDKCKGSDKSQKHCDTFQGVFSCGLFAHVIRYCQITVSENYASSTMEALKITFSKFKSNFSV